MNSSIYWVLALFYLTYFMSKCYNVRKLIGRQQPPYLIQKKWSCFFLSNCSVYSIPKGFEKSNFFLTQGVFFINLIEVVERFPTQEACIEHLEKVRWGATPHCPHCNSVRVTRPNESQDAGKVGRTGRWNCHECHASFKVTQGEPGVPGGEDSAPQMVYGNRFDNECQKIAIQLSVIP